MLTLWLDKAEYERLDRRAKATGINRSEVVRRALRFALDVAEDRQ